MARLRVKVVALIVAGVLPFGSCGGSNPDGPTPPTPGGTVAGRYLLEIRPAASCSLARGPHSFPMNAAAGGSTPHPGVQVVIEGVPSSLELEFKYTDFTLRGGLGTTGAGVLTNEGLRLWIRAIGTGAVTHTGEGPGEVTAGTLMGYVAVGSASDQFDALCLSCICYATDHSFTLKVR